MMQSNNDRCPFCQMPFKILIGQTSTWHVDECMDFKCNSAKECMDGIVCRSEIVSHYQQFSHNALARRISNDLVEDASEIPHKCNTDHESDEAVISPDSTRPTTKQYNTKHLSKTGHANKLILSKKRKGTRELEMKQLPKRTSLENPIESECNLEVSILEQIADLESVVSEEEEEESYEDNVMDHCNVNSSFDAAKAHVEENELSIKPVLESSSVNGVRVDVLQSGGVGTLGPNVTTSEAALKDDVTEKSVEMTSGAKSNTEAESLCVKDSIHSKSVTNLGQLRKYTGALSSPSVCRPSIKPSFLKGRGRCPFYKCIPGTGAVVDAFSYGTIPGVQFYFLSHFHSDHYHGLSKKFPHKIHCNKVTANLLVAKLYIPQENVVVLPMNEPCLLGDFSVELLEANHCPGAVMFLITTTLNERILHTGDFRASPAMESYPQLAIRTPVDYIFLDTTYCMEKYSFPPQEEAVNYAVACAVAAVKRCPSTVVISGTYTIGKEKIFMGIARALKSCVYVPPDKRRVLKCLEDTEIAAALTDKPQHAQVHVLPMGQLNHQRLEEYRKITPFDEVLAFRPTGWSQTKNGNWPKPNTRGRVTIQSIPYSEHSSYEELRRFVRFVKPRRVIPTVNVSSAQARAAMDRTFEGWLSSGLEDGPAPRKDNLLTKWLQKKS